MLHSYNEVNGIALTHKKKCKFNNRNIHVLYVCMMLCICVLWYGQLNAHLFDEHEYLKTEHDIHSRILGPRLVVRVQSIGIEKFPLHFMIKY